MTRNARRHSGHFFEDFAHRRMQERQNRCSQESMIAPTFMLSMQMQHSCDGDDGPMRGELTLLFAAEAASRRGILLHGDNDEPPCGNDGRAESAHREADARCTTPLESSPHRAAVSVVFTTLPHIGPLPGRVTLPLKYTTTTAADDQKRTARTLIQTLCSPLSLSLSLSTSLPLSLCRSGWCGRNLPPGGRTTQEEKEGKTNAVQSQSNLARRNSKQTNV